MVSCRTAKADILHTAAAADAVVVVVVVVDVWLPLLSMLLLLLWSREQYSVGRHDKTSTNPCVPARATIGVVFFSLK